MNKIHGNAIIPAIFICVVALMLTSHIRHYLNFDEGLVLDAAWELLNGRELYDDIFIFWPPGSFYLLYVFWLAFGPSYYVAKFIFLIAALLAIFGVFSIARLIAGRYIPYISATIFALGFIWWPIITYHTLNIAFVVWAIFYWLKYLEKNKRQDLIICGLLTSGSILSLQSRGLVLFSALALFALYLMVRNRQLNGIKKFLALISAAILPLSLLLFKWSPAVLYEHLVSFPLNDYSEVARVAYANWWFIAFCLLLLLYLLRRQLTLPLRALFFVQFMLLVSTIPLSDHFHLGLIMFPLLILFPLALANNTPRQNKFYRLVIIPIFSYLIFFFYLWPAMLNLYYLPRFKSIEDSKIVKYIKNNCADSPYIFFGPFLSGFYYESRLQNPTSYNFLITNHNPNSHFENAVKQLTYNTPKCAILKYQSVEKYNYNRDNPVDNYIIDNYALVDEISGFKIYQLNNGD